MKVYLSILKEHLFRHRFLYFVIISYFLIRIINLTKPPLFNDEAIYLDWGYREVTKPGFLYYSLYDAKQPLLMWVFGIMENLISNPIFAGRLVSVFMGFITLLGVYRLGIYIIDKKTALFASLLYLSVPLFAFYDRQALMESAVSAVGIWSLYYLIRIVNENKYKDYLLLGLILGIGFFIKSSVILFIISALGVLFYTLIKNYKPKIIEGIFIMSTAFFSVIFLLIINPMFWQTLHTNSRFSFGIVELLGFPLSTWLNTLIINFKVVFFYITPPIFIFGLLGLIVSIKQKKILLVTMVFYFLFCLILELVTIRNGSDRYLVSFLPLVVLFCSIFLIDLWKNKQTKIITIFLITVTFVFSLLPTIFQLIDLPNYLINMGKISGYKFDTYLDTSNSGYGLGQVYAYFDNLSKNKKITIGIATNTGNPESAVLVYYSHSNNVRVVYFDSRLLPPEALKYECLNIGAITYFVSREKQLVGLDKFLKFVKLIKNPYGNNSIGIYKLDTDCKGKTANLDLKQN